eukprot:1372029-Amorphochlora_amoeboformis.AAC.1
MQASVVNDVRNSSRKRRRGPPSRDTASSGRSYSRNYRKQGDPLKTFAFGDSKPSEGMILAMAGKSESQKRRAARNDLRQRKRISARKRKPDRNKMAKLGMKGRRRSTQYNFCCIGRVICKKHHDHEYTERSEKRAVSLHP